MFKVNNKNTKIILLSFYYLLSISLSVSFIYIFLLSIIILLSFNIVLLSLMLTLKICYHINVNIREHHKICEHFGLVFVLLTLNMSRSFLAVYCVRKSHVIICSFKIRSNFVHFCQNFQIFSPFLPFLIFLYILALFLKNRTHTLTF